MNTSSVVDSAAGAEGLAQRDAKAIATLDIHELARLPQAEIDAAVAELHAIDERHAERLAEFEAARQDVDKGHRLLVDKARAKVDAEMAAKYKPTKISKNGPDTVLTFRSAKQALAYSREYDARLARGLRHGAVVVVLLRGVPRQLRGGRGRARADSPPQDRRARRARPAVPVHAH